jgi:hypothetical protein
LFLISRATRRRTESGQSVVEFALLAPIMIFLLFAILDLSRIYTAMASVESAAREAADYGTALGAERWSATNINGTVAEMNRRACIGASDQPDYVGIDTSLPPDGLDEECSNPTFAYCIRKTSAGPCLDPTNAGYDCDDPENNNRVTDPPCMVTVTMGFVFHLFVPFQLDFFGVQLGLPVTLSFERDSTYVMTDIDVSESPAP